MAIYSDWHGTVLTGADADAFERQVECAEPNPEAKKAIERGKAMARELLEHGCVRVSFRDILRRGK